MIHRDAVAEVFTVFQKVAHAAHGGRSAKLLQVGSGEAICQSRDVDEVYLRRYRFVLEDRFQDFHSLIQHLERNVVEQTPRTAGRSLPVVRCKKTMASFVILPYRRRKACSWPPLPLKEEVCNVSEQVRSLLRNLPTELFVSVVRPSHIDMNRAFTIAVAVHIQKLLLHNCACTWE